MGLPSVREAAVVDAMNDYPTKITFGEIAKPARRVSLFSARTSAARTTSRWTRRDGQTRCVCPISSHSLLHGRWQARLYHSFGRRAAKDGHWRLTGTAALPKFAEIASMPAHAI